MDAGAGGETGDATALAAAIRAGRTTPAAAMEAALEAASDRARLGAIVHIDPDLGRAAAAAAPPGPFRGVPFLAKDLGARAAGLPAFAGSAALRRRLGPAETDGALFARFRAAGLAPFGVTATPEFGLALTCEPQDAPPCRNPWDEALSPGGSSGGAAAAVAAGIVAIAHATDAAGSIRVPAACCGLVGLKPGRGVIPDGPDFDNHLMGLASELVLARTVRDVAAAFDAVADAPRPAKSAALPAPAVTLAVTPRAGKAEAEAARRAARLLAEAAHPVREIDPAALDALGLRAAAVARTVLSVGLADWLGALGVEPRELSPLAAAVLEEGRATPAAALFEAATEMARIAHAAAGLLAGRALLTPILSGPPPRIGHFDMTAADPAAHFAAMEALAPNAALANVAGLPALALPVTDGPGLPPAVQLLGPPGSERALLALGAALEAATPAPAFPWPVAGLPR